MGLKMERELKIFFNSLSIYIVTKFQKNTSLVLQ